MKIATEDKLHLQRNPSAAVLVRVERPVYRDRALEIIRAIMGALDADETPASNCTPMWIKFDEVDGSKFVYPSPLGYAPNDKGWLDGLVSSINEADSYTRVRRFDLAEVSGKKKRTSASAPVVRGPKLSQFADRLPAALSFTSTPEAYAECQALASAIRATKGVSAMEELIASMDESFPHMYRANLRLHGKIARGMRLIGKHGDLRLSVFDRFVAALREDALHLIEAEVDGIEAAIRRWFHDDEGNPRDMKKFVGPGGGYDVLTGASLSPIQDMSDESTQYGELGSTVTVRWLDRDRWTKMGKTNALRESVAEEEEVDA